MTHFQFCPFLLWQHFEIQRRLKSSGFDGSSERDCQFEAVFNIFDTSGGPAFTLLYFRLVDQSCCKMGQFWRDFPMDSVHQPKKFCLNAPSCNKKRCGNFYFWNVTILNVIHCALTTNKLILSAAMSPLHFDITMPQFQED